MAKYRGKHNGHTRGPYIRRSFHYSPGSKKELVDITKQIEHYLSDSGYFISGFQRIDKVYSENTNTYHLAGASIGLSSIFNKSNKKCSLNLVFVSNDNIEDVTQKIIRNFQFLSDPDMKV